MSVTVPGGMTLDAHPDCERLSNAELPEELTLADGRLKLLHDLEPDGNRELETWLIQRRRLLLAEIKRRGMNADDRGDKHGFSLIEAKDLLTAQEPETARVWEGILPTGGLSLLVAKPKVGKTTLALNLAIAVSRGADFLGRKTQQARVIYLALEEKKGEVQKKLRSLGVTTEKIYFHFGSAPKEAVEEVGPIIKQIEAELLVIDVLQKFCRVKDLNDYAQVTRALEPLMSMARQESCHILLTHHAGKADRQDGDDILGSTGLLGGVDTSIHIKRRDTRRTFFTIQRYGEDVSETVISLRPDGSLEAVGGRQEVEIEETLPLILVALEEGPLVEKEVWARVERNHGIVAKALRLLVEQGRVRRTGTGKKGDPYTYEKILSFSPQDSIGRAGRESEPVKKPLELLQKCSPQGLDLNSLRDGSSGREFLIPKEASEDGWEEV